MSSELLEAVNKWAEVKKRIPKSFPEPKLNRFCTLEELNNWQTELALWMENEKDIRHLETEADDILEDIANMLGYAPMYTIVKVGNCYFSRTMRTWKEASQGAIAEYGEQVK